MEFKLNTYTISALLMLTVWLKLNQSLVLADEMTSEQSEDQYSQASVLLEIPSSFNPVGSGARALGQGGAFIAVADDATAASWNPGGLIQLRNPELSVVGAYQSRTEDNVFGTSPEANHQGVINNTNLNYLSGSMPCAAEVCGRNMVFSINYQNLFNFDKNWDLSFNLDEYNQEFGDYSLGTTNIDYQQQGNLYALGLAYAIQASETLSVGISLNFWEDLLADNQWQQHYNSRTRVIEGLVGIPESVTAFDTHSISTETYDFSGFNLNLGLLWNVYEKEEQKIMLGLVLKTPFTADIIHSKSDYYVESFDDELPLSSRQFTQYHEQLDMPMSYGIGLSYQLSDAWTVSGDIYRTEWDDFKLITHDGRSISPISNRPSEVSDIGPTHQIRIGSEYRLISQELGKNYIIPLRAGVFYDPAPAENGADDYYGFSIGGGIAYQTLVFDIAYQYRFGNDVNTQILSDRQFSQDVREHMIYSSMFYRF